MLKKGILLVSFFVTSQFLLAQSYSTAAGIRVGEDLGLTLQQHIKNNFTLEAMLTTKQKDNESRITLLLEKHVNLLSRGLNAYGGAGLHESFISNPILKGYTNTLGVSGIAGLELSLKKYCFSIDYRPSINFSTLAGQNAFSGYTAFSARYIFVKRATKFQEWKKKRKK